MSDLHAIADRVEIEALRGEFSDAVMMNDHDRLASLFTPEGAVRIPVGNIEAVGREQIRALGERRQGFSEYFLQTTHPGTIQLDGDTATGRAYLSELARLRDGGSHLNYFVYHDRYQRTSDGWKFVERVAEFRYIDNSPLAGSAPEVAGDAVTRRPGQPRMDGGAIAASPPRPGTPGRPSPRARRREPVPHRPASALSSQLTHQTEDTIEYKLDMSGMLATHDALRRDLVQVARIAGRRNGNPATRLHAVLGWELFKKFLIIHHQAEDDVLWPPLRTAVAGHPDRLALVDALEAEHAVIEPLLAGVDGAAADPDYGYQRFGDIIDELEGKLTAHLAHEESDGLPLIDASLPPPDWQHYSAVYAERIGDDASLAIPWLLDGASPQNREAFLSNLPAPVVATLRHQWEPRYAGLNLWGTPGEQTAGQ